MLLQRRNWRGLAALLKQLPVGQQLSRGQLGSRLDQSLLPLRKEPSDQRRGRDREDGRMFLIVSVEVGRMVWFGSLEEHPNDAAEKRESSGMMSNLIGKLWQASLKASAELRIVANPLQSWLSRTVSF